MKKNKLLACNIILSLILIFVPFFIAPVCGPMPNGKYMACHYSGYLVCIVAVTIVIISSFAIYRKTRLSSILAYIFTIILSVSLYILPNRIIPIGDMKKNGWAIGLCKNSAMPCNSKTFVVVYAICILLTLISIVAILIKVTERENNND